MNKESHIVVTESFVKKLRKKAATNNTTNTQLLESNLKKWYEKNKNCLENEISNSEINHLTFRFNKKETSKIFALFIEDFFNKLLDEND